MRLMLLTGLLALAGAAAAQTEPDPRLRITEGLCESTPPLSDSSPHRWNGWGPTVTNTRFQDAAAGGITEIVSLGLIEAPGALGADIVVAEGQSLGNPLTFGGPYVGLMATRKEFVRQMPGRLCGETVDADGARGFVLTLSTREQHIRREKATSNICTNSGLCALAFSIHLGLLGEAGLRKLARLNHLSAVRLADALAAIPGVELLNRHFFNEMTIRLPIPAAPVVESLAQRGILAGVPVSRLEPDDPAVENLIVLAATELTTGADIAALVHALEEVLA